MTYHPNLTDVIHEISTIASTRMRGEINVNWVTDEEDSLWISFTPVRPDGGYDEVTQWKFVKVDD